MNLVNLSKFVNLREISLQDTVCNLDAANVTADDISSSKSRVIDLNLSGCGMQSGVIFSKLKIFPFLETIDLADNSLTTMDLEGIRSDGGLRKMYIIKFEGGNNFNEKWLQETTARLSMSVIKDEYFSRKIVIYQ